MTEQTNRPSDSDINSIHFLTELLDIPENPDPVTFLGNAVIFLSTLLDSDMTWIYQADAQQPQLRMVAACGESVDFPIVIGAADVVRLTDTDVWKSGSTSNTELHRAAKNAKLACLVSSPLGTGIGFSGLLVVGFHSSPGEKILDRITTAGDLLSKMTNYYIFKSNASTREKELIYNTRIHNQIIDSIQEGVLVLDKNLQVIGINPSAEIMLGYASHEIIGQAAENVLIGGKGVAEAVRGALKGIPTHNLSDIHIHRRNGQAFPAVVRILPVVHDTNFDAVLVLISDMSENEQNKLRTQQLEHRAVLGEFTAVFAHEVRNPINNISTGLQLMSTLLPSDDSNQEIINRMVGDCNRLNHLMESLLAFSRPMESRFEPIKLTLFLKKIMDRWRPRFAKLNITPYFKSENPASTIIGEPRSLEQVFTNLISNAVEAMTKEGGTLGVNISIDTTSSSRPHVVVAISDTGSGIPEELRERIFEPFVTHSPRGTGLGLSITKQIVTAHKGSIQLSSFPGGTVFLVSFPAEIGV